MINMTNREFVRLVRQAYKEIPAQVLNALDNVDVAVEEWPGPDEEDLIMCRPIFVPSRFFLTPEKEIERATCGLDVNF